MRGLSDIKYYGKTYKQILREAGYPVKESTFFGRVGMGYTFDKALEPDTLGNSRYLIQQALLSTPKEYIEKYRINSEGIDLISLIRLLGSKITYIEAYNRLNKGYSIADSLEVEDKKWSDKKTYTVNGLQMNLKEILDYEGNPVNYQTALSRLRNGQGIIDAIKAIEEGDVRREYIIDGKRVTIQEAMDYYKTDLTYQTVRKRLRSGMSLEDAIKETKTGGKAVKYHLNGEDLTIQAIIDRGLTKLSYSSINRRLKEGMDISQAIEGEGRKSITPDIAWEGKSLREIYNERKPKISYPTFVRRVDEGNTLEDALKPPKRKKQRKFTYKGVSRSLKEIIELSGSTVKYQTVLYRLDNGMALEDALELNK